MSGVPKSCRKKHDFETPHKLRALRKTITELAINDFGYDVRPISEAPLFGGPVAKGKVVYGESLKDSGIYAGAAALAYPMHKVTTM